MATTVVGAFDELRGRLAFTAAQKLTAQAHINGLVSFCKDAFVLAPAGAYATGSYRRSTMVRWTRDVDVMATLSVPKYDPVYGRDSSKFLYMVRDALNEEYGSTTVSSKRVAVKLDFSDIVADVVPCLPRQGGGFLMPDGSGAWRATNPPVHTRLMSEADEAKDQRLKPLVKLMKAWNIANGHHLSSIHVELMVEAMWRDTSVVSAPYPSAVAKSLKAMPGWLGSSFPDPWPHGRAVDADLSMSDRQTAIRMLKEDAAGAEEAELNRPMGHDKEAIERWQVIYRNRFPAYG
jgi:hypothetical protein